MTKICNSCGFAEKENESLFCQICGSEFSESQKIDYYSPKKLVFVPQKRNPSFILRKNNLKLKKLLAFGILLIVIFSSLLLYNFTFINSYDRVGSDIYTGPVIQTEAAIELDFNYGIGEIRIQTSSTLGNVSFYAEREVFSKNQAKLENTNVTSISSKGVISVSFNENQYNSNFKFNFIVTLNSRLKIKNIHIDLLEGNIKLQLNNTYLGITKISTETGTIFANLSNMSFESNEKELTTKTGSIKMILDELWFVGNTSALFNVATITGSIYFELTNIHNSTANLTQIFSFSTTTGSINSLLNYRLPCGEKLNLAVNTGSITVKNLNNYSISEKSTHLLTGTNIYYLVSNINFEYKMTTQTGSILIEN